MSNKTTERSALLYLMNCQDMMERPEDMLITAKKLIDTVYNIESKDKKVECDDSIANETPKKDDDNNKIATNNNTNTFTVEERGLVAITYKNLIQPIRKIWRNLNYNLGKSSIFSDATKCRLLENYKDSITESIIAYCTDCLDTSKYLATSERNPEAYVFYKKMEGDYNRYIAEVVTGDRKERASCQSEAAYKIANTFSRDYLQSWHPIRLGLILNYAVFLSEIKNQMKSACILAESAYEMALTDIRKENLASDETHSTLLILQMLKDDIMLWKQELNFQRNELDEKFNSAFRSQQISRSSSPVALVEEIKEESTDEQEQSEVSIEEEKPLTSQPLCTPPLIQTGDHEIRSFDW